MIQKNNQVANYWNQRGETYNRSWQSVAKKRLSQMETGLVKKAITALSKKIKKRPIKTLDIGIAIGRISDEILKYDVNHYASDISQTMIQFCKEKYKTNKKVKQLKIHDIHDLLPKDWNQFNIVTAIRVLSYSPHLHKQLVNIYNAMEKGGILIFTYPNKYSLTMLSKLLHRNNRLGYETIYDELKKIVENVGFTEHQIIGFSRLLDIFYDKSNSNISTNILFSIEKFLNAMLGSTFFTRLFYIICKK